MEDAGYNRRRYSIDWHMYLWAQNGTPLEYCDLAREFLFDCVDSEYYGWDEPTTEDSELIRIKTYLDREFQNNPYFS